MTTIYSNSGRVQKVEDIGGSVGASYDETSDATKALNVDASGTAISSANPLPVTAVVTGDINIDNNAIGSMLVGKSVGGDFTTAYTSGTTITIGAMPYTHTFIADDVLSVQQIAVDGSVTNTFTRDDVAMTISGQILTVVGSSFVATDTFVVYTNISRSENSGNSTSDAKFTQNTRLNPEYAQVLDETNLSAVTVIGAGTAIDVSIYDKITVCIVASAVTTGGTFTFQASHQAVATDALWGPVASTGSNSTSAATQAIGADGVTIFEIDIKKLKYFRTNLTARTDGTYTVYVWG